MALASQALRIELGQAFGLKKRVNVFLKSATPIEPSRGINQTSNAGKPEALATATNQFSCSERRLFHPRALEVKGTSDNTGGKNSKPYVSGQNISPPRRSTSHDIRPDPSRKKAT